MRDANVINKRLRWSRRLSFVPRWIVMPTIRKQSVAEHSYHMAMTTVWLTNHHNIMADIDENKTAATALFLLASALVHDIDEAREGDVPSPNKIPKPVDPSDQVTVILKVSDILEAIAFIEEEKALGNKFGMDAVQADLFAKLHEWWLAFSWNDELGPKWITSDLVKNYLQHAVPHDANCPHPVMETGT